MGDRDIFKFWSGDCLYGLELQGKQFRKMVTLSSNCSPLETGGILIGFYTEALDLAVITDITGAPTDSRAGRTQFHRGTAGLQERLNSAWKKDRHYYLGEWHSHPNAPAEPSRTDVTQAKTIAKSSKYNCPEPLLFILGQRFTDVDKCRVYVFPKDKPRIRLLSSNRKKCEGE